MPRLVPDGETCDHAIVRAARESTSGDVKDDKADRGLIRYMMENRHTTPFEMVETKWRVKMPIFVARQWVRHRTASINELSMRYTEAKPEYWLPPNGWRGQGRSNRQGSEGTVQYTPLAVDPNAPHHPIAEDAAFAEYENRIAAGVSREQARSCLPVSAYTQWTWKIDLHNLLHFLNLRTHPHAQEEIRVYAEAMLNIIEPLVPWTVEAWRDYVRDAVTFTADELDVLRTGQGYWMSQRQQAQLKDKMRKTQMSVERIDWVGRGL